MEKKLSSLLAVFAIVATFGYLFGPLGTVLAQGRNAGFSCSPSIGYIVMPINLVEGGTKTITVDGFSNCSSVYDQYGNTYSFYGNMSASIASGAGFSVTDNSYSTDSNGDAEDTITITAGNVPENGGSIQVTYDVSYSSNSSLSSGTLGDFPADPQIAEPVNVYPATTMGVWDDPNPSTPLITTETYPNPFIQDLQGNAYVLQNGSQNTGMGGVTDGMSTSGQEPIPTNYVVCGVHTTGDGMTIDPIACPIDPNAASAGFAFANPVTRWHADSNKDGGGPIYCTEQSQNGDRLPVGAENMGVMNGTWIWGSRNGGGHAVDQPDCALLDSSSGVSLQAPATSYTLIVASPSANGNVYCPSDSVVVGAPNNEPGNNESISTFGCAKVLFPQTNVTPPTPTSTTSTIFVTLTAQSSSLRLGETTTLTWSAATTTARAPHYGGASRPASFNNAAHAHGIFAFLNVANADGGGGSSSSGGSSTSSIQCGFTEGSNASGPLPTNTPASGTITVQPTGVGNQTYAISCSDPTGGTGNATTTVTVTSIPAPLGMITVQSIDAVTHAPVASTWTFTAPAGSLLNGCEASSGCSGTSATYQNQPTDPGSIYTIVPVGAPAGYAFDSAASNGGYAPNNPMSQTLTPGATALFYLVWDPVQCATNCGNATGTFSVTANPSSVPVNGTTTITWSATATSYGSCVASGDWSGNQQSNGSRTFVLSTAKTYTFTLTCKDNFDANSTAKSVTVDASNPAPLPLPTCSALAASPATITAGASSVLSWSCSTSTTGCSIVGGAVNQSVSPTGNLSVSPTQTTTYELSCNGGINETSTVSVGAPGIHEGNP